MILLHGVFWETIEVFWCEIWFLRLSYDHWNNGRDESKNLEIEFRSQERWNRSGIELYVADMFH